MTIVAAFVPRRFSLPEAEARLFQVDSFSRLLGQCHWQAGKQRDTPVIVIVHGLEGSADSYYVQGIAEKAFHRGFHVVRLNQRNCGGTEKLTPTLYNSAMSGDYRAVFEELATVDGFEKIFFAGYSMGGNLVTKMAGEYGDDVPAALLGVCSVCPAMDLSACADALERKDNYPVPAAFCERTDGAVCAQRRKCFRTGIRRMVSGRFERCGNLMTRSPRRVLDFAAPRNITKRRERRR